jgi:hypothetical protein
VGSCLESFHQIVDYLISVFIAFIGKMQIDHSGFETGVAEVFLYASQVDACFEEMSSIGVSEGMNADVFLCDSRFLFCSSQSALDAAFGHWRC